MTTKTFFQQELFHRGGEISLKWAYQLAHCDELTGIKVSQEQIIHWTQILTTACFEGVAGAAVQSVPEVGADLANLCMGREIGLSKSLAVLSTEFLTTLPQQEQQQYQERVAVVLGELAIGFFRKQFPSSLPSGFPVSSPFAHSNVAPTTAAAATISESQQRLANLTEIQSLELSAVNEKLRQELIERRQTEDMLRQYNQELSLVNRVSQTMISTLNLEKVLNIMMVELHKLLPVAAYSVWLIDGDTNQLVCCQATVGHQETMVGWRLDLGQGVAGWVAVNNMAIIVHDTRRDDRHFKEIDRVLDFEVRSILSVPVRGRTGVIGVFQVVDTKPSQFTTVQLELVETLADAAGIAIENAKLYEQTRREVEHQAVLLREVDHRIKNNLSVLNSMIRLKLGRSVQERSSYEAITEDVINQIQSLTIVHNLLSASDWGALLMDQLARRVIESTLRLLSPGHYVLVEISPSDVWIAADQSHEIALIINELVTNSVKHALPQLEVPMKLSVRTDRNDQMVRFEYRDNGPGYQPETVLLDEEYDGLGLELLQQIVVHSLDGYLTISNDNGAVTVIEFNMPDTPVTA
jgi:two-component sensor histidine kinase/putative methionine-R-sulfoxide reductase with GAF domain